MSLGLFVEFALVAALLVYVWLNPYGLVRVAVDYQAGGSPMLSGLAAAAGLTMNVLLNLLLIPRLGVNGAAVSSSLSFMTIAAMSMFLYVRLSQNTLTDTLIIKAEDLSTYTSVAKRLWEGLSGTVKVKLGFSVPEVR